MIRFLLTMLCVWLVVYGLWLWLCFLPSPPAAQARVRVPPLNFADTCDHEKTDDVQLSTGEVVTRICLECDKALPPNWGCMDCEWVDVESGSGHVTRFCVAPCKEHKMR
jgi:hypothetical protein